jgi:hypothetical protein
MGTKTVPGAIALVILAGNLDFPRRDRTDTHFESLIFNCAASLLMNLNKWFRMRRANFFNAIGALFECANVRKVSQLSAQRDNQDRRVVLLVQSK